MTPSLRASVRRPKVAAMPLETSAQSPAPVRQVANLISQYVDRLGAVWVEGQIAQINRRPGLQTVFMVLRDAVADISVPLTVQRSTVDSLATPLVEGASVVVQAKPSYYANRGSFSLAVREIRMVGLGELLARLERRRQLLAAEGLFARELKRSLPFLPDPGRPGHRAELGGRARRARQRPPPLAQRRLRGRPRHRAGAARRRRGDRGAPAGWSGTPTSTSSWSPGAAARSRTCCRSPTRR